VSDTIIDIIYGDAIRTSEERDKLVRANKEAVGISARAVTSFWAVDFLPFREWQYTALELRVMGCAPVRHLPWTAARRFASKCLVYTNYVRYEPWKSVLEDQV
jgi:hypothetical protein